MSETTYTVEIWQMGVCLRVLHRRRGKPLTEAMAKSLAEDLYRAEPNREARVVQITTDTKVLQRWTTGLALDKPKGWDED